MERKDTILIACASKENRQFLRYALSERFHLLESGGIKQCLLLLEQNRECIATLVIGSSVIDQETREILDQNWEEGALLGIPVVLFNETGDRSMVTTMFHRGAAEVVDQDDDSYMVLRRVENVTQLYLHRQKTEQLIHERSETQRKANETLVDTLSSIIEYRSAESGNHVMRIRQFVRILLKEVMRRCPEYKLTEESVEMIASASALHDVGKIATPDAILLKPGPLTSDEWEIMKTHSYTGYEILQSLEGVTDPHYLRYAQNICHYHHERWDGSGYPDGLKGDQIPICAQVVGLADAYEALTAERVYKPRYSFDQAINMILKGECGAFSPKLLSCLKNVTESYEMLTSNYSDERLPMIQEGAMPQTMQQEAEVSSLERVQAMYYCLVHYINGLLIEVNLDMGLFHTVYNPYPEIADMSGVATLDQLCQLMLEQIIVPEEKEQMRTLIYQGIHRFVDEDLRRASYRFHHQTVDPEDSGSFEMTLLRVGVTGSKRRSLAILFRKLGEQEDNAYEDAQYTLATYDYICLNDQDFTLLTINPQRNSLAGYTPRELKEDYDNRLSLLIYPEDREQVRKEFTDQLKRGTSVQLEHRVVKKDGTVLWVANKSRLVVGEDGREQLCSFLTDITKTRSAMEDLNQRNQRYIRTLGKTENVLFEWDIVTDVMEFSDTWENMFQNPPPQDPVRKWITHISRIHPDDVPLLLDRISNLENGSDQETQEVRISSSQGRYTWYRIQAHAVRDRSRKLTQVVGVITNIDTEKQKEQLLMDRAERDSLTKLLNKDAAKKRIGAYLEHYPKDANCAMLVIDLDDFKQINDTYGHLFGDAVLTKVAQEIKRQFQGQDIVSRIGGDEFMVLCRGLTDRRLLEERCRRMLGSLCENLRHQNQSLNIKCSIGIALAPGHGKTYQELFNHADRALYQAKVMGKNTYCFYDPEKHMRYDSHVGRSRIDSDEEPGLAENSLVRHVFKLLYSAEDVKAAIDQAISYLGKRMNVSRVYIFENTEDGRYCNNTFEWCNEGIQPEIQNLQHVSYETDVPGFLDCFDDQGLIYSSDVKELPEPVYDILEPQGIISALLCAIKPNGIMQGYIGFDECVRPRLWTREEIQMLTYFAEVLSTFLMKARRQEKIASQAQDIMTILENQNNWIYIIDPDTWEVHYMNKHAQEYNRCTQQGLPCYQTIRCQNGPCADCPAQGVREKKTGRIIRRSGDQRLLFEATMIRWNGKESCLVTGRALPKEVEE